MDHKTGGTCPVFSVWPVPLPSFEKAELLVPLLRAASGFVAHVPTLGSLITHRFQRSNKRKRDPDRD